MTESTNTNQTPEAILPNIILQWEQVREQLRGEFGEAVFKSWLKPLFVTEAVGETVRIAAPTRFMRDWVVSHYVDRIRTLWKGLNPSISIIDVIVKQAAPTITPLEPSETLPAIQASKAFDESVLIDDEVEY